MGKHLSLKQMFYCPLLIANDCVEPLWRQVKVSADFTLLRGATVRPDSKLSGASASLGSTCAIGSLFRSDEEISNLNQKSQHRHTLPWTDYWSQVSRQCLLLFLICFANYFKMEEDNGK